MTGSLVFLTPSAAFVAVVAVLPLLAVAAAGWRVAVARRQLGLAAPPPVRRIGTVAALAGVVALLALAAAQPALRSTTSARVRTDAQAIFVLDVSRSMLAAHSAHSPTRLARAKRTAILLRNAIPEVPSGLATMTDRVLPSLFPNADPAVFDNTVLHAIAIEQPPPADQYVVATSLASLGVLGTQNYFPPTARRRLVVVITDGESRPFDPRAVAQQLGAGPGIHLVLVHVWASGENVYDGGQIEAGYHEDPASAEMLASLAAAAGGSSFSENALGSAIQAEKAALGKGPTIVVGKSQRTRTIAPYVALLALLPLAAVLLRGVRVGRRHLSSPSPAEAPAVAVSRPSTAPRSA